MVQHRFTREAVVKDWLVKGIQDFIIDFRQEEHFPWQSAFFYQQGVEKLCKAYLLGERAEEYEKEPTEEKAWEVISNFLTSKKVRHNISGMLRQVLGKEKMKEILNKTFDWYDEGTGVSGAELLMVLKKAYIKCRYPEPDDITKKFPFKSGRLYYDPFASQGIKDFACEVSRLIIDKIRDSFGITIPEDRFTKYGDDWIRFRRNFFRENI